MTPFTPLAGTVGGVLIGLSAVLLMGGIGRVVGLSGIFAGVLSSTWTSEQTWRALFLAAMLAGTIITALLGGIDADTIAFPGTPVTTAIGGLLVGVGTALGSGCTSGHGICGMSRLSPRSIASTAVFMAAAIVTVFVIRHVLGS